VLARYAVTPGYLFYPANFWPHKNHVTLLLALRHLRETYGLDPRVVLVGDDRGTLDFVWQKASELGVLSQIRYLGFVHESVLASLYHHAAALVFLSFFGPGNIPPLEAFALGCPAILSDVPAAREQAGEAALYFRPDDPVELAEKIATVLRDPVMRKTLVTRGRQRGQMYTPKVYWSGVLELLNDLSPMLRTFPPGGLYFERRRSLGGRIVSTLVGRL